MVKHIKNTIFIQIAVLFFSLSSVLMKLAGAYDTFSWPFVLLYGAALAVLAIYAVVWQMILKKTPLNIAYSNRAFSTVWNVVWGVLLFGEHLTPTRLLGTLIIIVGICFVVTANEH